MTIKKSVHLKRVMKVIKHTHTENLLRVSSACPAHQSLTKFFLMDVFTLGSRSVVALLHTHNTQMKYDTGPLLHLNVGAKSGDKGI